MAPATELSLVSCSIPQINGVKIGKGITKLLREGNEIAFGSFHPQPQNNGIEDYRERVFTTSFSVPFLDKHFQALCTATVLAALQITASMHTTISALSSAKVPLLPS
jgi:hypothetical protein